VANEAQREKTKPPLPALALALVAGAIIGGALVYLLAGGAAAPAVSTGDAPIDALLQGAGPDFAWLRPWAELSALRSLAEIERVYELYRGWQYSIHREAGLPGAPLKCKVTFSAYVPDGHLESFLTYVHKE